MFIAWILLITVYVLRCVTKITRPWNKDVDTLTNIVRNELYLQIL